jgi:cytochrome c oxidase subunit 4
LPRAIVRPIAARQAHAISNPTLANIEKRWENMPPEEQADLWMALRDRMKVNWSELTLQEKKAGTLFSSSQGASRHHQLCETDLT